MLKPVTGTRKPLFRQCNLGTLYYNGRGCRKDYEEAVFWVLLAANQGNGLAAIKLGFMYEGGRGVTQDLVQAYKWYNLGGTNGETMGIQSRDELAKRMTPAQIHEAQQLTKEWMAGAHYSVGALSEKMSL